MVSNILPILSLATAVWAHPQRHQRFHYGTGTGRGSGIALPTGGTFPLNGTALNGTDFGGSANVTTTATATAVMTVTVSAIPLDSVSSVAVANAAVASSSSCCSSLTSTITATSVQYFTYTAEASVAESAAAVASSSVAAASSSTPSDSGLEDLAGSTSISLLASTPTAGAFFGRPSYAADSSVQSVVPTTFATVAGSASVPSVVASSAASSVAASVSASVPSSSASSTPSTGTSSGSKKGLSYNDASLTSAFAGTGISWAYNWGASPDGSILAGAEYVPLLWGESSISSWSSAVQSAISSGSKHVLSFNEPDLSSQSNMDPATAAKLHIANVAPLSGQVSIGSPAITNGAGSNPAMGTTWLQQFFDACEGQCNIDFVAFHWYAEASNVDYFKSHVQDVIDTAAKNGVSKVWLTEFGATGSDSDVASFLSQVVPWLDSQAAVERYAYFMCSDGILVNGNSVSSPVGQAYVS
ncbi:hypothetical protein A1O1_04510 [Capronia coronata CBS 617.96]|uniref:Asl1-like glycosyl hydrolase catalytic domain-containing protein n=1 Tax=Capronia coronata CBS 617.96 TaxID=1182541 RepID=W9YFV6_9EURO|nr:uncharacterized protein A1O1_04510 [Capronia coronata CBS 617.96]EXJ91398.1 hypothetical protein A1O1_04510 [Capronia coronata CBS 617.96]